MDGGNPDSEFAEDGNIDLTAGLLDAVQDIFYVCETDGTVVNYNDRVPEITGYAPEEIESMNAWEFFAEGDRERIADEVCRIVEDGYERRTKGHLLTADGETIPYEFTGSPLCDRAGEVVGFAGTGRDISEREAREVELERQNDLFEKAQDIADVGAWEYDPQAEEAYFTDQVYEIYGVDHDHDPTPESDIQRFYHPDDRETVREAVEGALEDGEPYDIEVRITAADGTQKWVRTRADPLFEDGTCKRVRGTIQDITERKEHERELTRQRDNLELLDQMVRHDLRNHLQVVSGHAEALADHVDEDGQASIEKILESIETATELTRSARDLAEVMLHQHGTEETFGLRRVIEGQVAEARTAHGTASITLDGPVPDIRVGGDEMLPSIFRNLLQNAVQHNDKAVPRVVVSATERDGTVRVRVADNGPGIADERKAEIFGRGEMGLESDGTGIGLYLVETLVESYGGDVWVEDREERLPADDGSQTDGDPEGAVFVVELPTAESVTHD